MFASARRLEDIDGDDVVAVWKLRMLPDLQRRRLVESQTDSTARLLITDFAPRRLKVSGIRKHRAYGENESLLARKRAHHLTAKQDRAEHECGAR